MDHLLKVQEPSLNEDCEAKKVKIKPMMKPDVSSYCDAFCSSKFFLNANVDIKSPLHYKNIKL